MKPSDGRKKLSERELFFYEDHVCGEADAVYRFCFGLTLNQESAHKLVRLTYKEAAESVSDLIGKSSTVLRLALLKIALKHFEDSDKPGKSGSSPVVSFLKQLSDTERAVAVAVDVLGLTVKETSALVGEDEPALRLKLVKSRKALLQEAGLS
jgi:hypothetical protein